MLSWPRPFSTSTSPCGAQGHKNEELTCAGATADPPVPGQDPEGCLSQENTSTNKGFPSNSSRAVHSINRDSRALGQLVDGSGTQVVISLILSVTRNYIGRNRQIHQVNGSEAGVSKKMLGFFECGMIYSIPGLLTPDRISLSQKGKGVLAQELAGLFDRTLVWKGERENTRLASNEQWDCAPKLEERSSNGITQSASQLLATKYHTWKHFCNNEGSLRNKQ